MKDFGKRILSMLCAVAIVLSMIAGVEFTLPAKAATDGLSLSGVQIVVPATATSVEQTAATELQTYLYKITGVQSVITEEGKQQSGAAIFIGNTARARLAGVSYPTEGDENGEAWAIQLVGERLFLVGAATRGPLYAVYHLLEDVFGVHWWNMWEEEVPKGDAVVPTDYADSGVPAMEYRGGFYSINANAEYTYFARNRMNSNLGSFPSSYGGQENYGDPAHVHTFNRYFTDTDFASNPEWFSQVSGSRVSNGQLCLTNSSLKTEFASRLIANVANDPDAIYSVSPNDNTSFCECSSCQSQISTYGYSGYVLNFVNEMANAVADAGYTDATIEMLVYWAYIAPPSGGVVPADNVSIRFADNYIDLLHGLDHANNADTLANIQSWINISSSDVYYWQYVVNYNNNGVLPTMFYYGDDMVLLQEMGVNGWFAEQEQCINADFWDMKLWLIAKLMEEPVSGDEYAALMDEFIYGYYGEEAGQHIRDYLYYMNGKAEATSTEQTFSTNIITADWLTVQDIIAGNDYFEKAFAAANGDETLLRRLRAARSGLDRVIHDNFVSWSTKTASAGLTLPFTAREVGERIYQTMTEQIAMRGSYDPDYPRFYTAYENKYGENKFALPSELSGYAREHVLEYTAENFRTADIGKIVDDSDSVTGKAFYLDTSGMSTVNSTQRAVMKEITIKAYDPSGSTNNGIRSIGSITSKNLTLNSGYKLYSVDYTVPSDMGNDANDYVYLFENWSLQIPVMKQDLNMLIGKTVRIYISVKAVGSLSYSTYFKGQYYIDRIFLLPTPDQANHSYSVAPSTYGDSCRSVCSACGDVVLSAHSWDEGVVTKEPTSSAEGEMLYTCTVCGGTKTEAIDKLADVFDGIHEGHRLIRDYSAFNTAPDQGTDYVDDTEAYGGKAVCYSKSTLDDSSFISIYRYDVASGLTDPELKIGGLTRDELAINDGYHVYKFTYAVPEATTAGNVFYIMNNWQLNSSTFCADFADYAGQTVNVYLSIKVTGPDTNGYYSIFVDRVALESLCADYMQDGVCTVCGNTDKLLKMIPDEHLAVMADYTAFPEKAEQNTSYVADEDAYNGMAVCHLDNNVGISITRYDSGVEQKIGTISSDALKIGQGYQIHKFTFNVPANSTNGNFLFIMSNWQFQSTQLCYDLAAYAGQTVELYISMKVTGPDSDGYYALYIDRVAIATVCDYQETETGVACAICGRLDELRSMMAKDHGIIRDYSTFNTDANEKTVYVDDDEAFGGKAVCHTTANPTISINRYDVGSGLGDGHASLKIGSLTKDDLKIDLGYHIYQFTYEVPAETTAGNTFYIMPNWQLNNSTFCADFAAFAGKTVEVYLSMKVTANADSTYSIYVDRVALESHCEDHADENGICTICGKAIDGLHTHSWGYAYTNEQQHTCTCSTCGAQQMEDHSWDDGVVTQEPTWAAEGVKTYTCAVCKGTKTEAVEKLPAPVSTWNLVLDGNIGVNFVMNVSQTDVVAVTVNGEAVETQIVDGTVSVELAAAQMTDVIAISVNGVALPNTYSVRGYADYILEEANGYDDATKNLVKAMLVYGGASQTYFGYNTESLASDGITVTPVQPEGDSNVTLEDSLDALNFYGASLSHRTKTAVRFYFTGDVTNLSFAVNGETVKAVEKDGKYYVEIADINPQDIGKTITVTVTDGTDTLTVGYSPLSYIVRMYNKADSSANTKSLVQALYGYYLEAVSYTVE